jgi:hypothetical protein
MAQLVQWGRDVGVPAAAWPAIDGSHDSYLAAVRELDRSGPSALAVALSSGERDSISPDVERELLRRIDRLLEEEERLAMGMRHAWLNASPEDARADQAVRFWSARRLLGLGSTVPSGAGNIYGGVLTPLPDLDALELSSAERQAAEAALEPHLPELIERTKAHLRARTRVMALGEAVQRSASTADEVEQRAALRAQAIEPVFDAARKARFGMLRAQQAARRSIVASLPPERQEKVGRELLSQVAPGMRATAVGGIAETLVPYLHDLDDRTQRKLTTKLRQLRSELKAAERRHAEALEQAIDSADFDGLRSAGDAFELTLNEVAVREGRGMVALVGVRVLEPMVALETGSLEGERAQEALATLMPASRIDDFLRDLSAREPAKAALLQVTEAPRRTYRGALLTNAGPVGSPLQRAVEGQVADRPDVLPKLRQAFSDHSRMWRDHVVPAQRRFREVVGAAAEEGEVRLGLSLALRDGQLVLDHEMALQPALRAAAELDTKAAEVDAALFAALEPILAPVAPEAMPPLRSARAWELYAADSSTPLSATIDPRVADPVDGVALFADAGIGPTEQAACLLVGAEELASYAQALRDRLERLTTAALLRRHTSELQFQRGQYWIYEPENSLPEAERRLFARAAALREEAATLWRAKLAPVLEAWSAILAPSDLDALRDAALFRSYAGLTDALQPMLSFVAEAEAGLALLAAEDPRRLAAQAVLDARLDEARQGVREIALALERASAIPSGMVVLPQEPSATASQPAEGTREARALSPAATSEPGAAPGVPAGAPAMRSVFDWKVEMLDDAARAVRDLWVVTGDPSVLDRPAARAAARAAARPGAPGAGR